MTELEPLYLGGPPAQINPLELRQAFNPANGEGVAGYDDMRVSTSAGMVISVAAGEGYIRGDTVVDQGLYRVRNDAAKLSSAFDLGGIGAAHATLPRIDRIIARVYDTEQDASGLSKWRFEVLAGTATAGATLDNLNGVTAVPNGAMLLADIVVGAAVVTINAADIRDRRPFCYVCAPPLLTDLDEVPLIPLMGGGGGQASTPVVANAQMAYAASLPRKINGATRIRWGTVSSTAASTLCLGIYDASGRKIVDTGSISGAVVGKQSTAIASVSLESGVYWVFIGAGATAPTSILSGLSAAAVPNVAVSIASGGVVAPQTLLGMAEASGLVLFPSIALSVG